MFQINTDESQPAYRRVMDAVIDAIAAGDLAPGDKLPPHTTLSKTLALNAGVVRHAYEQLTEQGLIASRRGSGTFVSQDARQFLAVKTNVPFRSVVMAMGYSDLSETLPNRLRAVTDVIAGLRQVFGEGVGRIRFVKSVDRACLGNVTSDDAVLSLCPAAFDVAFSAELMSRGVPVIGVGPSDHVDHVPHATYDMLQAVTLGCRHLHQSGHRRMGYIGGLGDVISMKFFSFVNALHELGLDYRMNHVKEVFNGPAEGALAYQAAQAMIQEGDLPDAIFVDSDLKAIGVVEAARHAGLSIPNDLAVIGYGDVPEAAACRPGLTSVRIPLREIGMAAAEMLLAWDQQNSPPETRVIKASLVERETTMPRRKARTDQVIRKGSTDGAVSDGFSL